MYWEQQWMYWLSLPLLCRGQTTATVPCLAVSTKHQFIIYESWTEAGPGATVWYRLRDCALDTITPEEKKGVHSLRSDWSTDCESHRGWLSDSAALFKKKKGKKLSELEMTFWLHLSAHTSLLKVHCVIFGPMIGDTQQHTRHIQTMTHTLQFWQVTKGQSPIKNPCARCLTHCLFFAIFRSYYE